MKYLPNGQCVDVVAPLPSGGFVVTDCLEDDTGESFQGEPYVVPAVLDSPCTARVASEYQAVADKLDAARKELAAIREEIRTAESGRQEILARISQKRGLERIDDFLSGRIRYVVMNQFGRVKVLPLEQCTCEGDDKHRDLKLISLFGDSNGNVFWRANQYKDGSGCWHEIDLCLSRDEAMAVAAQRLSDLCESYHLDNVVASAKELGIPLSPDVLAKWRDRRLQAARKDRDAAIKKLAECDKKITEIESV